MAKVEFVAIADSKGIRDGSNGYSVYVNEKQVIDWISDSHMRIGDNALNDLWEALGVKMKFDYE